MGVRSVRVYVWVCEECEGVRVGVKRCAAVSPRRLRTPDTLAGILSAPGLCLLVQSLLAGRLIYCTVLLVVRYVRSDCC